MCISVLYSKIDKIQLIQSNKKDVVVTKIYNIISYRKDKIKGIYRFQLTKSVILLLKNYLLMFRFVSSSFPILFRSNVQFKD